MGRCIDIKFRKSLLILEDIHLCKGGLNQIMFLLLCLELTFVGVNFNSCLEPLCFNASSYKCLSLLNTIAFRFIYIYIYIYI